MNEGREMTPMAGSANSEGSSRLWEVTSASIILKRMLSKGASGISGVDSRDETEESRPCLLPVGEWGAMESAANWLIGID